MRVPPSTPRPTAAASGLHRPLAAEVALRQQSHAAEVRLSGVAGELGAMQAEAGEDRVRPEVVAAIRADLAAGRVGTEADLAATVAALLGEL